MCFSPMEFHSYGIWKKLSKLLESKEKVYPSRQMKIRVAEHRKAWEDNIAGKLIFDDHLINSGHRPR